MLQNVTEWSQNGHEKFRFVTKISPFLNKISIFHPKFRFFTKILIFSKNVYIWPKFRFLTQISTFQQNLGFWSQFPFLAIISIFDQNFHQNLDFNFDFWPKLRCMPKLWIFPQILIFDQNFDFNQNFQFLLFSVLRLNLSKQIFYFIFLLLFIRKIFGECREYYRMVTKMFDQNFIFTKVSVFDRNFHFWQIFTLLTKIYIFDENFPFSPWFRFFTKIFTFESKIFSSKREI